MISGFCGEKLFTTEGTESTELELPVDEASYAVLQDAHIEIDKQRNLAPRELQIRHHLRLVDRSESLNGLDFDNDRPLHQKVDPVAAVQLDLFVNQRMGLLLFYLQSSLVNSKTRHAS